MAIFFLLSDYSIWILFITTIITVYYGAVRSIDVEKYLLANKEPMSVTVTTGMAIMYPILGSIVLTLFFYFFNTMSLVMFFSVLLSSVTAISFTFLPLLDHFCPKLKGVNVSLRCTESTLNYLALLSFSGLTIFMWLVTGNWALNNVIGLSFSVFSISFLRIPNLKVASILLIALFFYDIFWVFFSENIFGESVMVKLATTASSNPFDKATRELGLFSIFVPSLQLPMKVIWGDRLLGLGDIVIPGTLVAYSAKVDYFELKDFTKIPSTVSIKKNYFYKTLIGYSFGLFLAIYFASVFRKAQPALLYIVPCTLLPILLSSCLKGHQVVWSGKFGSHSLEH